MSKNKLIDLKHKVRALCERDILANVKSDFVVRLHWAFQSNSNLFMVLDYMPGGDLYRQLRKMGDLPLRAARFYIA